MNQRSFFNLSTDSDPLIPFKTGFEAAVAALERFGGEQVVFETRSPLVVILAPMFRKLQERLTIAIPVEALNDGLHRHLEGKMGEPGLPLPSERLSAARTLKELGFNVEIKLRPYAGENFTSQSLPLRALEVFARICDQASTAVTLGEPIDGSARTKVIFSRVLASRLVNARLNEEGEPAHAVA